MQVTSQFKYTTDLGIQATKAAFRIKKTKKDVVTHSLVIVFVFIMTAILVWDIVRNTSFVIDLIILIALVGVEIFNLIMPKIIIHTQKKFLNQLNLAEIQYTETAINKDKCTETYYKDNKIMIQNVCDMTKLVGYEIKDHYVFSVFNNFACAIFDTNTLNISLEELVEILDTKIAKNKVNKSNKI